MAKNKSKEKNMGRPIESHETASWANKEKLKEVSNVSVPSEMQIEDAKDYADQNKK